MWDIIAGWICEFADLMESYFQVVPTFNNTQGPGLIKHYHGCLLIQWPAFLEVTILGFPLRGIEDAVCLVRFWQNLSQDCQEFNALDLKLRMI